MLNGVLFAERANEFVVCGEVKALKAGAVVKASMNSANESHALDPKPGELAMARLKLQ